MRGEVAREGNAINWVLGNSLSLERPRGAGVPGEPLQGLGGGLVSPFIFLGLGFVCSLMVVEERFC